MEKTGFHPEMEMLLTDLAMRIAELRQKMNRAKNIERIKDCVQIERLERRYKALEEQLRRLDLEGPGLRQNMKAELDKLANDLAGAVEYFMMSTDSAYRPEQRRKPEQKS